MERSCHFGEIFGGRELVIQQHLKLHHFTYRNDIHTLLKVTMLSKLSSGLAETGPGWQRSAEYMSIHAAKYRVAVQACFNKPLRRYFIPPAACSVSETAC